MSMWIFAWLLALSVVGWAETKPQAFVICKNGSQVRTVRVEVDGENICHTIYSKQGTEKDVGNGKNKESCAQFLANIRINLEKSNWKCRDVESATVDESAQ